MIVRLAKHRVRDQPFYFTASIALVEERQAGVDF
jgi:hypothetical protein